MKACSKCGETKRLELFNRNKNNSDGRRGECKDCQNQWNKGYYESLGPEYRTKVNSQTLVRKYGITPEQRDQMIADQGGCAICGTDVPSKDGKWHVDHDHACCDTSKNPHANTCGGCIRGILCGTCNRGIGQFEDDPDLLLAAAAYLISHSNTQTRQVRHEVV